MKTVTVGTYETAGWSALDQCRILVNANEPDEEELLAGTTWRNAESIFNEVHITHKDWFLDRGITRIDCGGQVYEMKEIKKFIPVNE